MLLVGWDAADWRVISPLLDEGKLPNLERLIDTGVIGNLSTLQPMISPMLWTSIATGKTADKHGILGFTERDPAGGARPSSSTSRKTKAIWNILQQSLGWRCNVVGWWATHPAEPLRGTVVTSYIQRAQQIGSDEWQVPPHAVHPPEVAHEFAPLRMLPSEITEELVLPFIPRAAEIDQRKNTSLESFASLMSECCTIQAVATAAMERADWDFTAVYFDSIDHFSHAFMPYHPPKQAHISEADFEMFKDVIAGIYRLQDMMLGRLLELAGPDSLVIVCSDHGFQSGTLRPLSNPQEPAGPIFWHREFGMFVMSGPGVRRDERIYGATLLDVTPTILTLLGLPAGADMDGKVLLDALEERDVPERIRSWDEVPGDSGQHPPGYAWEAPPEATRELLQQFAALGYIDPLAADQTNMAEGVEREARYNQSQVLLSSGRSEEAVEVMEELVKARSWESRYIHQLANAYLKAGYFLAADDLLALAYPDGTEPETPLVVWILRARAKLGLEQRKEAIDCLRAVMGNMLRLPVTWVETGWLWLRLKEWSSGEACFKRALELDSESATAWEGLAAVRIHRHENSAAIEAALEAVQLLFQLPLSHYYLGIALARERKVDEAIIAFRRVLVMRPTLVAAHRWLAALYSSKKADSLLADTFRNEAFRRSRERATESSTRHRRAKLPRRAITALPSPSERLAKIREARPHMFQTELMTSGKTFVLVSGLPRSGTSLMMQMLAAGGMHLLTDDERAADIDNPNGYCEWEPIKRIGREPDLLDAENLDGSVIKCISMLLPQMPKKHHYKVIFMTRPIAEVVRSQTAMIDRLGTNGAALDEGKLERELLSHREQIHSWLRTSPHMEVIEIDYRLLIKDTPKVVAKLGEFLGSERLPNADEMGGVVDASLYRRRVEAPKVDGTASHE